MAESATAVIYCLLPRDAADALEDVRAHYRAIGSTVQAIVDRRAGERRGDGEQPWLVQERREGTDRRRFVVPRRLAPLPPGLAERAGAIKWIQHMPPVGEATEALSSEQVLEAVRAGDAEAPTELYWRQYQRIHSRLVVLLGSAQRADETVRDAFGAVLDALELEGIPEDFDELLYRCVDAAAHEASGAGAAKVVPDNGLGISDPALDEPVVLSEADPDWASTARTEREALLETLGGHVVGVEHVGSTAVPRMPARPILDFIAGVARLPVDRQVVQVLKDQGFAVCGDAGTPGRLYLRRRGEGQAVDLHLIEHGGPLWEEALALCHHLRRSAGDADRWARVKQLAAMRAPDSAARYYDLRRLTLDELLERCRSASEARAA